MQPGASTSRPTYRFETFELDSGRFELRRQGSPVRLEKIPMELLLLLAERRGELVTRQEILARLWDPNVFVDTEQGINTAIRKIRQAITSASPKSPELIQTVVGKGYRLAVPVEVVSPVSEHVEPRTPAHTPRFRSTIVALLVPSLAAAALYFLLRRPSATNIDSLAVLPFENYSGDASQDYFADGVTDAVITRVAQSPRIKVISRTSVMRFKGTRRDLSQIAREIGVDAVVEGSVSREGQRVRITAQLIDAHTDRHLWADKYDRDFSEILQVQDDIAQRIASSVNASLAARSPSPHPTPMDPGAYDNYLRARALALQRTPVSLAQAIDLYERTLAVQPQFDEAWSGLADAYAAEGYASFVSPQESFPKAEAAAQRALELNPNSAEAHATLGYSLFYFDWNGVAAQREFEAALRANHNHALTYHWRSVLLTAQGKYQEAEREIGLARTLDPLSLPLDTDVGFELYYAQRYDDAIRHLTQVLSLAPNFPPAHLWLGRAYEQTGNFTQSISELERAGQLVPDWSVNIAALGHSLAVSGDTSRATHELERLQQLSHTRFVTPYAIALIYAGLNDKNSALDWLERAQRERSHWLVWLPTDPRFANLHDQPRFRALVSAMRSGL